MRDGLAETELLIQNSGHRIEYRQKQMILDGVRGKNGSSILCIQTEYSAWSLENTQPQTRGDSTDAINSIRRLTNDGKRATEQANDVSLLWRHSSWVRSRTLERAYRKPFLTVFGKFEPQNIVGHRVDPKKGTSLCHNGCFELLCVRIHPQMTSVGESGEKIKNKNKKRRGLIFHVFRQTLPCGRLEQILGYVFVLWT